MHNAKYEISLKSFFFYLIKQLLKAMKRLGYNNNNRLLVKTTENQPKI